MIFEMSLLTIKSKTFSTGSLGSTENLRKNEESLKAHHPTATGLSFLEFLFSSLSHYPGINIRCMRQRLSRKRWVPWRWKGHMWNLPGGSWKDSSKPTELRPLSVEAEESQKCKVSNKERRKLVRERKQTRENDVSFNIFLYLFYSKDVGNIKNSFSPGS